jgi:hypothetical protein
MMKAYNVGINEKTLCVECHRVVYAVRCIALLIAPFSFRKLLNVPPYLWTRMMERDCLVEHRLEGGERKDDKISTPELSIMPQRWVMLTGCLLLGGCACRRPSYRSPLASTESPYWPTYRTYFWYTHLKKHKSNTHQDMRMRSTLLDSIPSDFMTEKSFNHSTSSVLTTKAAKVEQFPNFLARMSCSALQWVTSNHNGARGVTEVYV